MRPTKLLLSASGGWDIEKTFLEETDMGNYVLRKELWTIPAVDARPTEMTSAYTKDGKYIGNVETAKLLCEKYGILPEVATPEHRVCSIGYSPKDGKWYGWSHRAIYGFKAGDKIKKDDCGYNPEVGERIVNDDKDAKLMAMDFAESVSSGLIPASSSSVVVKLIYGKSL